MGHLIAPIVAPIVALTARCCTEAGERPGWCVSMFRRRTRRSGGNRFSGPVAAVIRDKPAPKPEQRLRSHPTWDRKPQNGGMEER
jgi:hypothetical protein